MIVPDIVYSYVARGWLIMAALLSPPPASLSSPAATASASSQSPTPHDLAAWLGPRLSQKAEVLLPGTPGFENGTRTFAAKKPQLDLLVKVATTEDVQTTVRSKTQNPKPITSPLPSTLVPFLSLRTKAFRLTKVNQNGDNNKKKYRFASRTSITDLFSPSLAATAKRGTKASLSTESASRQAS